MKILNNPILKQLFLHANINGFKMQPEVYRFLQDFFDKIFVVSVPRFTERHEKVKQNLAGLSYDFFWGADKLKLDYNTAKKDGTYDEQMAQKLQRQGKALNLGEIACSLSHRMVYEEMLKHNWQKVLILEDDILPLYNNLAQLTAALKRKQMWYKILSRLGLMKWTCKMVANLLPKPYSTHLKKAGFHDCTHAYAVTLQAAKKLLAAQTPVVYRADDLLSSTIMKGELEAFVTEPKFFDQEIFHNAAFVSEIR